MTGQALTCHSLGTCKPHRAGEISYSSFSWYLNKTDQAFYSSFPWYLSQDRQDIFLVILLGQCHPRRTGQASYLLFPWGLNRNGQASYSSFPRYQCTLKGQVRPLRCYSHGTCHLRRTGQDSYSLFPWSLSLSQGRSDLLGVIPLEPVTLSEQVGLLTCHPLGTCQPHKTGQVSYSCKVYFLSFSWDQSPDEDRSGFLLAIPLEPVTLTGQSRPLTCHTLGTLTGRSSILIVIPWDLSPSRTGQASYLSFSWDLSPPQDR
jgi:hypothetical protein